MKIFNRLSIIAVAITAIACGRLSDEARGMIGNYYISEISEDTPLLELKKDGSCVVRAIRPGVLTFSVAGTWNVLNDSLLIELDPTKVTTEEGDSSLVGNIPSRMAKHIVSYNEITLETETDGVTYSYHRRNE